MNNKQIIEVINNLSYKKAIKGLIGHSINSDTLLHYNSKSIVYSFKKNNKLDTLLSVSQKTEYLLKSIFLSMYSLISKPVYLIKHDKVIIRLFVFLSPKVDIHLDSSLIIKEGKLLGVSPTVFTIGYQKGNSTQRRQINKFLNFKQVRPKITEILKNQILYNITNGLSIPTSKMFTQELVKIVNKIIFTRQLEKSNKHIGSAVAYAKQLNIESVKECFKTEGGNDKTYTSFSSTFRFKLEKLSEKFRKIFKKEVEFEIIKAQLPFQDSHILAQILGYNANNYKFTRMLKILIPRAVIKNPSTELNYIPTNRPHKQASDYLDFCRARLIRLTKRNLKVKDINMLSSQPSSYLPPFFFSKYSLIASGLYPLPSLTLGLDINTVADTQAGQRGIGSTLLTNNIESETQVLYRPKNLTYLTGINIKLAGRLMTQSIRPRFTVQSKQEGSLARVKVHYTEKSRFTGKNKRGAFSFTVLMSHIFT
jgi:hypothetical protein